MLSPVEIYKMLLDGSQWGRWSSFRLPIAERCVTTWTPVGTPMHWRPATWYPEHASISYFWIDRWYALHVKYAQDGTFLGCYCDIVTPNLPLDERSTEVRYVDLYVDVVVHPDRSVSTKDEEVYARAMHYNPDLVPLQARAFAEMDELARHARQWTGPFAAIPPRLIRLDWERLDPMSATYAQACDQQWGSLSWEG